MRILIHFFHGLIGSPLHFKQAMARLAPFGLRLNAPTIDYLTDEPILALGKVKQGDVVVGNSIGCALALECDARAYILTAPPFDFSNGAVPLRRAQIEPWVSDLYQGKGQIADEPELRAEACEQLRALLGNRHNLARIRALKAQAQGFLTDPRLMHLQDRIHFVIGAQDYTTPPKAFAEFVRAMAPRATVTVLPGCGHAVPVERPEAVASIISGVAA